MDQLSSFVMTHWPLFVALLVVLTLILVTELQAQRKLALEISPQAAIFRLNNDNALIFDLRDENNFRQGHIIDAIRVSTEDLEKKRFDLYKSRPVIIVCERGLQSQSFAVKLREQQFSTTLVLAGGISAWKAAGLPLVKGK